MSDLKKIISIGTLKGGVGKTSTIFNIGGILSEQGCKVLIIDLDPQANSSANFGINIDNLEYTSSNMFLTQVDPSLLVQKGKIKELPNFDIIPSTIQLTETEMQLLAAPGREKILMNYIRKNYDWFKNYDYVLIDTNPSMSLINQNAFVAGDHVILITEPAANSYTGVKVFIDLWEQISEAIGMKNNISAVIINKVEKNEKTAKDFLLFIEENQNEINKLMLKTYIPKNVAIKDALETYNIPINVFDKKSKGYLAMMCIMDELKERGVIDGE